MSPVWNRSPLSRVIAPKRDRSAVVIPHGEAARNAMRDNAIRQSSLSLSIAGEDYQRLRHTARAHLLAAAASYVQEYLPSVSDPPDPETLVVMTGHQPEYFHAGVWYKNFLANALARNTSAVAIHLIVDNDLCRSPAIRVPAGSASQPRVESLRMDTVLPPMPFEERRVTDWDPWQSFGDRVATAVAPFVTDPMIRRLWPIAQEAASRHGNLGRALCESRHRLEHQFGLDSWEVPLSRLCETPAYFHFVAHLLDHLPRFHTVFHYELAAHRREFRVRSRTHPAPPLGNEGDWLESPFWIWTADRPERQPLWIRRTGAFLELRRPDDTHSEGVESEPSHPRVRIVPLVSELQELARRGIKIRPRALTLTMFARMFLCDLFIHGIGGARYDRLTDQLIDGFFHVTPPEFVTATATCYLPIPNEGADQDEERRLEGQLRDLWYHPERYLATMNGHTPETIDLARQKEELVILPPPRGERKVWHESIAAINHRLRGGLQPMHDALLRLRHEATMARKRAEVFTSREYPFCLFSGDELSTALLDMARRLA